VAPPESILILCKRQRLIVVGVGPRMSEFLHDISNFGGSRDPSRAAFLPCAICDQARRSKQDQQNQILNLPWISHKTVANRVDAPSWELQMRACLFITLCLVAGWLAGCTLIATQQTANQTSSCLQDIKSSQEGQIVYTKLWASDATDTAAKLSDPNALTPTERDALVQVHNNIISCRQMIISDDSRSTAWRLPYWLDYFKRSDAIFDKLASGEIPVGLANKLTIESNGKFQADVSRRHPDAVPIDEAQQQQAAEALVQASAQITAPEPQSKLTAINCS
jgi:hypothetical protein